MRLVRCAGLVPVYGQGSNLFFMKTTKTQPIRSERPNRHYMLVLWKLLYRIDVQTETLHGLDEIVACLHSKLDINLWNEQKRRFPREWDKMLKKRERRLAWFNQHGSVPDGWTPPDPNDPRRTANKPIHAYLARRKLTLEEFNATNGHIPLKSKLYGAPETNWHLHRRIRAWQKD